MSFFKEFKEDFAQAAKELMPGEEPTEDVKQEQEDIEINTLESDVDVESELAKLDDFLEEVDEEKMEEAAAKPFAAPEEEVAAYQEANEPETMEDEPEEEPAQEEVVAEAEETVIEPETEQAVEEPVEQPEEVEESTPEPMAAINDNETLTEEKEMDSMEKDVTEEMKEETPVEETTPEVDLDGEISDEEAVITQGMTIRGDVETAGSIEIRGNVTGNVKCRGKLVVTGKIEGNSDSSEFFADSAKITGEINSTGTVKVGLGSVIVGNISATSAVVAGAIKGDIDVQGPVVVDTSAVIKGNIKSRSVQINNGAVIDGFCSQVYADIDMDSLFGDN
ncbi:MAG: polymer-forming cytoskeletal protein [Eubacterium sp.]|nr:polymer-forming cytoskeletal protein [Eubacterium sp.]